MKKIKVLNLILLIISCIMILCSNLIALNAFELNKKIINKNIVIMLFCIIVAVIKNLKSEKIQSSKIFIIIWISLMISVIISKIINNDKDIFNIIILLIISPFFFIKNSYNTEKYIFWGSIINLIPLLCILKAGNTISLIIVMTAIVVINMNLQKITEKNNYILYTIIVIIFGIILYMTKSRTSLITFITISMIDYIYIMLKGKFNIKKFIKSILIIMFILIIAIMLYDTLQTYFFNKYSASQQDMTSGRTVIWKKVLSDKITALGNGSNYIEYKTGLADAHNIFIQILGCYGLIPLLIYLVMIAYIIIKILKKDEKIKFVNFYLAYFMIGMFENILILDTRLLIYNVLFLVYTGMLLRKNTKVDKNIVKNEKNNVL